MCQLVLSTCIIENCQPKKYYLACAWLISTHIQKGQGCPPTPHPTSPPQPRFRYNIKRYLPSYSNSGCDKLVLYGISIRELAQHRAMRTVPRHSLTNESGPGWFRTIIDNAGDDKMLTQSNYNFVNRLSTQSML